MRQPVMAKLLEWQLKVSVCSSSCGCRRGEADELQAVVDELFVDLVGEDDEVRMLHDDVRQRLELVGRVGVAAGVAGGVDDEHFGLAG